MLLKFTSRVEISIRKTLEPPGGIINTLNNNIKRVIFKFPKIVFFISFLLAALFFRIFVYSPYVTWDSLHYLQLSLKPVYGDTHSLIFGYILKEFAVLSTFLGNNNFFKELIFIFHYIALVSVLVIPIAALTVIFLSKLKKMEKKSLVVMSILFWLLLFPSLLIFMSAVWSEMLYFLVLMLFVLLVLIYEETITKTSSSSTLGIGIIFICIVPIAYHVRFQFLIVPIAVILATLIVSIRSKKRLISPCVWSILGVMLILASNFFLKRTFNNVEGASAMTRTNLAVSMQCALRCEAKFFKIDCNSFDGERIIKSLSCSDLLLGFVDLGGFRKELVSIPQMIQDLGVMSFIKFIIIAPFSYLFDIHKNWGLEIGRFEFLQDNATLYYKEATKYYAPFLQVEGASPKYFFVKISTLLKYAHFKLRLFNWLCAFFIILNSWIIFKGSRLITVFLAFVSLGTWLVFAYFNPHVPFRFLVHILIPGFIAVFFEFKVDFLFRQLCQKKGLPENCL